MFKTAFVNSSRDHIKTNSSSTTNDLNNYNITSFYSERFLLFKLVVCDVINMAVEAERGRQLRSERKQYRER